MSGATRSLGVLHLVANRWWTGSADPVIQLALGLQARGHRVRLGIVPGDRFETKAREAGLEVRSFGGSLLFEPWTIRTGSGTPFSVFSPFWRACLAAGEPRHPLPAPAELEGVDAVAGDDLSEWRLLPTRPDWAAGLRETWQPGEAAARRRLREFVRDDLADYATGRDRMDRPVTSRLSPRLRWGELSPHQVWHATNEHAAGTAGARKFLSEVGWREFAWHVLFHAPDLATRNWRAEFDAFPWPRLHPGALRAWERGRTGVPLVDAGMRELWATGSMHNRIRMVTASFLTKNLLIDWRLGEQWFWDTLVDADAASNPFNWQWVAGSGADAAPYFRVFNPELQAAKFDPDGVYVDRESGVIAYNSPLASSLIGHNLGETVEVRLPAGVRKYLILDVKFADVDYIPGKFLADRKLIGQCAMRRE